MKTLKCREIPEPVHVCPILLNKVAILKTARQRDQSALDGTLGR
jgi:hypothetical protein